MSLKQLQLTAPDTWKKPVLCRFVGRHRWGMDERGRWVVDLEDQSGRLSLEVCQPDHSWLSLRLNTIVEAEFTPLFDDGPIGLALTALKPAQACSASQTLSTICRKPHSPAARQALDTLQSMADELGADPLGGFLARVLNDPAIGPAFLTAPASTNHHHAHAGGLLVHTVEVMRMAGELARLKLPHQPRRIWQAWIAAFNHDLGKVLTHGGQKDRVGPNLSHEFLSIRLVSPHIDWLATADQESATELSASLQHGIRVAGTRSRTQSIVAELVALADQCSAMHLGEMGRAALYAKPAANDTGRPVRGTVRS